MTVTHSPLTIVVAREVKSCNDWMYAHFRKYMQERDAWMITLRVRLRPRTPPTGKVRIRITSRRGKLLDFGNFVAGCKPIPDCLSRMGYLRDDKPRFFECEYVQVNAPKGLRGTTIEIWPEGEA